MARNRVQFQKGYSLTQFMDEYGTEEKCREALFRWGWPNGFVCPRCSQTKHCRVQSRALYQCSGCRHQVAPTGLTAPEEGPAAASVRESLLGIPSDIGSLKRNQDRACGRSGLLT